MTVPVSRITELNCQPYEAEGEFVLYWLTANARLTHNFALQQAGEWAVRLQKPLLICHALACNDCSASKRHHLFQLQGMADIAALLADRFPHVVYYPFVETTSGQAASLLKALADLACVMVSDNSTLQPQSAWQAQVAQQLKIKMETVDSNGLLPVMAAGKTYPSAVTFRRLLQRILPAELLQFPSTEPLTNLSSRERAVVPQAILERFPPLSSEQLNTPEKLLTELPIDQSIDPAPQTGGCLIAQETLHDFLDHKLFRYLDERNDPDADVCSQLSPYLHFGHISSHQIFLALTAREEWSFGDQAIETHGRRSGWWHMSAASEAFLDQLVTWRELGFNMCAHRPDYADYDSLPDWARATLDNHRHDLRPYRYTADEFHRAETHDPLWNAAQRQLVKDGRIHNYLRMLWGKKILEWSATPEEALQIMIELNNRYALDGCDPNSYSGIFWCLGRYDRPWPERPIYGKIRSMSSQNTARKISIVRFLKEYGP